MMILNFFINSAHVISGLSLSITFIYDSDPLVSKTRSLANNMMTAEENTGWQTGEGNYCFFPL